MYNFKLLKCKDIRFFQSQIFVQNIYLFVIYNLAYKKKLIHPNPEFNLLNKWCRVNNCPQRFPNSWNQ